MYHNTLTIESNRRIIGMDMEGNCCDHCLFQSVRSGVSVSLNIVVYSVSTFKIKRLECLQTRF
jgi:hypothetical protein